MDPSSTAEGSSSSEEIPPLLFQLPMEIISYIISLLNLSELGRLSSTCMRMFMLIQSDNSIWRKLCQKLNLVQEIQPLERKQHSTSTCWMCYLKFVNNLRNFFLLFSLYLQIGKKDKTIEYKLKKIL